MSDDELRRHRKYLARLRQVQRVAEPLFGAFQQRVQQLETLTRDRRARIVAALVSEARKADAPGGPRPVAVIAVDPSSPITGGAILGDRVRMQIHASDRDVFIRSMASRGHGGGLATATVAAAAVLDASGFPLILIETVGTGQSEVEVAAIADTTIVVQAPEMGDEVSATYGPSGASTRGASV